MLGAREGHGLPLACRLEGVAARGPWYDATALHATMRP